MGCLIIHKQTQKTRLNFDGTRLSVYVWRRWKIEVITFDTYSVFKLRDLPRINFIKYYIEDTNILNLAFEHHTAKSVCLCIFYNIIYKTGEGFPLFLWYLQNLLLNWLSCSFKIDFGRPACSLIWQSARFGLKTKLIIPIQFNFVADFITLYQFWEINYQEKNNCPKWTFLKNCSDRLFLIIS